MVGFFVLLAVLALVVLLIFNSKTADLFDETIQFHIYLKNAQGISRDTVVKVSGINVGKVTGISIDDSNRVHIVFKVFKRFHSLLRTDSKASIGKLSLIGSATIELTAGSIENPELTDGVTLSVEEPLSIDELIASIAPIVEQANTAFEQTTKIIQSIDPESISQTMQNIETISSELLATIQHINGGSGPVGSLLYSEQIQDEIGKSVTSMSKSIIQLAKVTASLQPTLDSVGEITDLTAKALQPMPHVLKQIDRTLLIVPPLLEQLQQSLEPVPQIMQDVKASTQRLPMITEKSESAVSNVNQGLNSINKDLISRLPELLSQIQLLLEQSDQLVRSLQNTWPISAGGQEQGHRRMIESQPLYE